MKYNIIWLILEVLLQIFIYYFNLQNSLLGNVLFPYRYVFIIITIFSLLCANSSDIDHPIPI